MSLHHIVFVHGVSGQPFAPSQDYAAPLETLISNRLPPGSITYSHVDYSDVGAVERAAILSANKTFEAAHHVNWLEQLNDSAGPDAGLRQLLVQDGGNVLVYQQPGGWRDIIRQRVVDAITPLIGNHKYISVVGHSLGAVVAFDTIYYNVWHNPDWVRAKFYPQNLFTMGSPQALFAIGSTKPRFSPASKGSMQIVVAAAGGAWLNLVAGGDVIAYPLEWLYGTDAVKDIATQGNLLPLDAHGSYWTSPEVAGLIAAALSKSNVPL